MPDYLAERAGLIRIALGRSSPLRGALCASKTLARFVEQRSHPLPPACKAKRAPLGPIFALLAVERVLRGGCSVGFLRQYGNLNWRNE
jgi:hypothetical protein